MIKVSPRSTPSGGVQSALTSMVGAGVAPSLGGGVGSAVGPGGGDEAAGAQGGTTAGAPPRPGPGRAPPSPGHEDEGGLAPPPDEDRIARPDAWERAAPLAVLAPGDQFAERGLDAVFVLVAEVGGLPNASGGPGGAGRPLGRGIVRPPDPQPVGQ